MPGITSLGIDAGISSFIATSDVVQLTLFDLVGSR
ncbi:hypothetical protein H1P_3170009 [Hyella patelloides LEGE 07179]|uniref:Uncharacterized protein n=1 Tax=Hyella patelloides LEGE 07179 TaxID=945734 RepID=A0A563VVB8_9CYAN|nr:hypothetical protein H1P_3170009 [Hyella patelloides LEGE 07179]